MPPVPEMGLGAAASSSSGWALVANGLSRSLERVERGVVVRRSALSGASPEEVAVPGEGSVGVGSLAVLEGEVGRAVVVVVDSAGVVVVVDGVVVGVSEVLGAVVVVMVVVVAVVVIVAV